MHEPTLSETDLEKQDAVDNAIERCVAVILQDHGITFHHDIAVIGEIRDRVVDTLSKTFKLAPETIYP